MWLYLPSASTSSASAPAAEASISASDWRCQMLTRSLWWRGKPSRSAIWSQRLNRVSWLKRLSGAMCEPSQAAHGAELWMASLAASRASRIPSPESASERKTSAISGPTPAASSSSPAPGSSSSRTSRACSPRAAPSASCETFADLVIRLRSDYSARQKRAQAISATASSLSLWLTATKEDHHSVSDREAEMMEIYASGTNVPDTYKRLRSQAVTWPTPTTRDWKDTGSLENVPQNCLLGRVAAQWMTPRIVAGAYTRDNGNPDSECLTLEGQAILASSLPDHPISTVGEESSHIRRTLNPLFVEWLMGWPPGWTSLGLTPPASNDCACSATELSAWKRRMHSALLSLGLPPMARPAQLSLFG